MEMSIEITTRNKINRPIDYEEVFITWLPNESKEKVLAKVVELHGKGYKPVPHIAAFKVKDAEDAKALAAEVSKYTDKVLMIRGGGKQKGEFSTVAELVATGAFDGLKIGVGGFPEENGSISYEEGIEILKGKTGYASFVVTQWSLNKKAIARFLDDSPLPVYLGVPNRCSMKQLVKFASVCGIENSVKGVMSNPINLLRFMFGFSPNYIVNKFREHMNLDKIHVYSFGNYDKL